MVGVVPGRMGRGRPVRKYLQDIENTLGMRVHADGKLVTSSRRSFEQVVKRAVFRKGL